jgi:hypothetical protein
MSPLALRSFFGRLYDSGKQSTNMNYKSIEYKKERAGRVSTLGVENVYILETSVEIRFFEIPLSFKKNSIVPLARN